MLAALGVVCRDAACVSKFSDRFSHNVVVTRFVLRSDRYQNVPPILFVETPSHLIKHPVGAVHSTLRWYEYAIAQYDVEFTALLCAAIRAQDRSGQHAASESGRKKKETRGRSSSQLII